MLFFIDTRLLSASIHIKLYESQQPRNIRIFSTTIFPYWYFYFVAPLLSISIYLSMYLMRWHFSIRKWVVLFFSSFYYLFSFRTITELYIRLIYILQSFHHKRESKKFLQLFANKPRIIFWSTPVLYKYTSKSMRSIPTLTLSICGWQHKIRNQFKSD